MDIDNLRQDLSYTQGLLASLSHDTIEKQAIVRIANVLEQLSDYVKELEERYVGLEEYMEMIDEDLDQLEKSAYNEEQGDTEEDIFCLCCPECKDDVYVDEAELECCTDDIHCPKCGCVVIRELNTETMEDDL